MLSEPADAKTQTPVVIYTDGGCRGNPGIGAWGAILRYGKYVKRLGGADASTTNNKMELTAVIEALRALKKPGQRVQVFTDSQYVVKGMTEWLRGWKRRGWKKADKKPVENRDLWQALDAAAAGHNVAWNWVRGHAGNPGNEEADAIANALMDRVEAGEDAADVRL